jgi:tetratricopeptide (TPR) repeat protein
MVKQLFYFSLLLVLVAACGTESSKGVSGDIGATGVPFIDSMTQLINKRPGNAALYAARAEAFYKRDNCEMAIRDMSTALNLDSTNIPFHHLLADIFIDCEQSLPAIRTLERAATLAPDSIHTLLKLSEFQFIVQQYNESMQTVNRILKIQPANAEAFFMLGQNFRELGDTTKAINAYQRCTDLDAQHTDGWLNLGLLYERRKNPVALKYYDNVLKLDSLNREAMFAKAMYYMNRYDDDTALEYFKKVVAFDKYYQDAYINSGMIYLARADYKKALDQFTICTAVDPLATRAYYYRGLSLEKMSKDSLQAAIASYKTALGQSPSYQEAKDALLRLGAIKN